MKLINILRFALLALILLPAFRAFAQTKADTNLYQKREFRTADGRTLPYRLLYPENYDRSKKYPLVVFLHGSGERGTDNEAQLTHGAGLFLKAQNRSEFPCFVVFPQCPTENSWASYVFEGTSQDRSISFDYSRPPSWPSTAYIDLVKELVKTEKIDRRRLYISGLSMGGMGAFETLHRYPTLFAAAAPICGGGDVAAYDKRVSATPFWIFHGADDSVVKAAYSREMVEKLKTLGANVQYNEYPGVDHNSWDNAFAEPDYVRWMFSHSRRKKATF